MGETDNNVSSVFDRQAGPSTVEDVAIRSFSRSRPDRMPYVTGQTQVIEVARADNLQVVAIGGNTGRVIGWGHYTSDDDDLIRRLEREGRRKAREAKAVPGTDARQDGTELKTDTTTE